MVDIGTLETKHFINLRVVLARFLSGRCGHHFCHKLKLNIGSTLIYRFPVIIGLRRKVKPPYSDYLPVLSPLNLIGPRSKQVKTIQQLAGVPKTHWKTLYLDALLAFARYVQQLPASESHHHSWAGGP